VLKPMTVTARLAAGIAHPGLGLSLDGILASRLLRHAPPPEGPDADDGLPADLDLPLGRCPGGGGALWHWAATWAWPDPAPGPPEAHRWTKTAGHRHMGAVCGRLPRVVPARQGRHKRYLMPLIVVPASRLVWAAVGDPAAVENLLAGITNIGKRRHSGEGQVIGWDVQPTPALDPWAAAHLSPDGRLSRPCPPECLAGRPGVATGGEGAAGLRPPHMAPARQTWCALPAAWPEQATA